MQNRNNMRLPILILATVLSSTLFGQTTKHPFSVSAEFLITRDFSVQSPDVGQSFHLRSSGIEPALGIMFEFPVKNNLWFGAGYRWKEHWITWASGLYKSNLRVETAHSLPLKISWRKDLGKSRLLNRFSLDFNGGILISKMAHSLIMDDYKVLEDGNGNIIYTFSETYKNKDVNQVKASISLDGMAKVDYRLYRNLHLYFGYGYTQGFWSLAKGSYNYAGLGGFDSGTMTNKGSYQYIVLGLRRAFP